MTGFIEDNEGYTPHQSMWHMTTTDMLIANYMENNEATLDDSVTTLEVNVIDEEKNISVKTTYARIQHTRSRTWTQQWEAVRVEITSNKTGECIQTWTLDSDINWYRHNGLRAQMENGGDKKPFVSRNTYQAKRRPRK